MRINAPGIKSGPAPVVIVWKMVRVKVSYDMQQPGIGPGLSRDLGKPHQRERVGKIASDSMRSRKQLALELVLGSA